MLIKNIRFLLIFISICTWFDVEACKKKRIPEERPIVTEIKDDKKIDTGKENAHPPVNGIKSLDRLEHHWLVSVYKTSKADTSDNFLFTCFGNIINKNYVVSVATCYTDSQNGKVQNTSRYMLATGKQFINYDDWKDEKYVQKRQISEIIIPQGFKGNSEYYKNDIALLKLKEDLIINDFVKPISLDHLSLYSLKPEMPGIMFFYSPNKQLKKFEYKVLSRKTCEKKEPSDFLQFITEDKFCAESNDMDSCLGASGTGLVIEFENAIYLKGLVSVAPVEQNECSGKYPIVFTDVNDHLLFVIESQVNDAINIRYSV